MKLNVTNESGTDLTERWHDQTLDLESMKFVEAERTCEFIVMEPQPEGFRKSKSTIQDQALQQCRVTVGHVTSVQVLDAEGEVELYINVVETTPDSICVKCVNGVLELRGQALIASLDVEPSSVGGEGERSLSTPLGDITWRRKQK